MANALLIEPLPLALVTSSTTARGFRASNVGRDERGLVWRSAKGSDNQVLTIDLGADVPLDSVVLTGLAAAQSDWLLAVSLATETQGAFTGAFWAGDALPLLAGAAMPVGERGRALWLAPDGAPAAARYLRLTFSALATTEAVEVGRVVVGQKIQLARNFRFGAAFGVRPLGNVDFTRRGVMLRQRGVKLRGVGLSFGHIYRDEVEAKVQPLQERLGNDEPLAIVTDPEAHAERQNRIYFGVLTGDLGTVWARPGGFQADFNLVSLD